LTIRVAAGQRRDGGHLVVRERDFEDLQVFAQLFDVWAPGMRRPVLLHEPPQRDLRDAQPPPPGDLLQDRVVQDRPRASGEWAISTRSAARASAPGAGAGSGRVVLRPGWPPGRRRSPAPAAPGPPGKLDSADRPRPCLACAALQTSPRAHSNDTAGLGQWIREQIDIVRLQQAQALVQLVSDVRLRRRLGIRSLVVTQMSPRGPKYGPMPPDRLLVAVVPGCVDVAVALSERRFDEVLPASPTLAQRPKPIPGHRVLSTSFFPCERIRY